MSVTLETKTSPAGQIVLRAYQPGDQPAMQALWETTRQKPYSEAEIERLLRADGRALVAERTSESGESQIVGTLLWSHNGQIAFLFRVAVVPEFREQGIATLLVDQAEHEVREAGLDGIGLLTREANDPAKSLYAKLGYRHNDHIEFWTKRLIPHADLCDTNSEG